MRTRGRSVSTRPLGWSGGMALAVFIFGVGCGSPGSTSGPVDPATAEAEEPAAPSTLEPLDPAASADPVQGFLRHCERTLLVRADAAGTPDGGDVRGAWFGALVVPVDGPGGHSIAALGDVLLASYREAQPEAARAAEASLGGPRVTDFEWAVPRLMELRAEAGVEPFREVMRALVDRGRDGTPMGIDDLAGELEKVADADAVTWARAWLAAPVRPTVRAQWRHDGSRGRVLVRVDQVHAVQNGAPAAFPFTLPVRIHHGDGSLEDAEVRVTERRSLGEVACPDEPVAVTFDPDGALDGLVVIEEGD